MLVVGEKSFGAAVQLGKEYYVICPHCGERITFHVYSVRTCIGRQGCGGVLPVDPRELMLCSRIRVSYHFEKVGKCLK